jgi:hypothetical protein
MKTITLQIAGYESAAVDIAITPSDTALEILTRMGLEECALCSGSDLANPFEPTEAVFEKLRDGQAVYAILPTETYEPIDTSEDDAYIRSWFKKG